MDVITTTDDLKEFCARARAEPFIAIDTEFLSEKTYYAQLCLVQIALKDEAVCIDPLAEGIDLAPLKALLKLKKVLKVFHAARQDVAIFHHLFGEVPTPLYDTQIAAMVCGYGDSVGYQTLVQHICKKTIGKAEQFTDWSKRPLSHEQIKYALSDVIYLRKVYEALDRQIIQKKRQRWITEDMDWMSDPATYAQNPDTAWEKIRVRHPHPKTLNALRHVAAWREQVAQTKNQPRQRILRDEALIEIATQMPLTLDGFLKLRAFPKGLQNSSTFPALLKAVNDAHATPKDKWPVLPPRPRFPEQDVTAVVDLLRVLLKQKSTEHSVAARLIASADDLKILAQEKDPDLPALKGWRKDVFGADALKLKQGKLAARINDTDLEFFAV